MSLLGSLFGALFGTKKPKKKTTTAKKTRKSASSGSSKSKAKKSMSANTGTVQVTDAHPRVRYSFPKPPSPDRLVAQSRSAWQPPGRSIRLNGRTFADCMIYVGSTLDSIGGRSGTDPALIDPKLDVAGNNVDTNGTYLSYWPSYSELRPESRAAYLNWLQAGRPAGAPVGYVFLFFYGLERRVMFDARHDATARTEIPMLLHEVERLKRIYPDERSFQGYAAEFLVAGLLMKGEIDPREIEPPMPENSWELPLSAKVALGTFAANGQPIPPIWALSWLHCDPDTRLRTPAKRCKQEFMTLFRLAYQQQFGQGMVIDPPKRTLELAYRPASAGFNGSVALGNQRLPDVSHLRKPQFQLREIADRVTRQLDEYSRAVGAGRPGSSPSTLAHLPSQLGDISRFPSIAPLASFFANSLQANETGTVDVAALLVHFPELGARPSQKQAASISRLAQRLGYAMEPDPAINRKAFVDSQRVGLYRLDGVNAAAIRDLGGAVGMLSLSSLVASVDGAMTDGEARLILDQVTRAYALSPVETRRMRAHLAWLATRPATPNDARKRLAKLTPAQAQQTGRFLIAIAGLDGYVSPDEVKLLSRLYMIMGLRDQQLHSDLHNLTARPGPVRVFEAAPPTAHRIPEPRAAETAVTLDPAYLRLVQQQTAEIAGMLDQVFAGDDAPEPVNADSDPAVPIDEMRTEEDDPYQELIEMLAARPSWEMLEVATMAGSLGLMASGAIETINDRAMELGLEPLMECDEICDVYEPTLKDMLDRV